jgi:MFS family permease
VRAPLLPLVVFRNRQFVGATSVGFALSFSMLAILLYSAYYLQGVLGYGAIKAGALLLPATVPIMFAAPVATKLVARFGFRPTMAGGLLLVAGAAAVLTQVTASTGYLLMLPAFILLGAGIGLAISPTSGAAISSVPPDKAGAGAGVLNMGRQVGGALGIAIVGSLVVSLGRTKARHDLTGLALSGRARSAIVGNVGTGAAPPPNGHAHLPTSILAQIEQIVHESFAHGMSVAMFVPLAIALLGSALALMLVRPPREPQQPALSVLDADIMMLAARSGNWLIVPPEVDSAPTPAA